MPSYIRPINRYTSQLGGDGPLGFRCMIIPASLRSNCESERLETRLSVAKTFARGNLVSNPFEVIARLKKRNIAIVVRIVQAHWQALESCAR